MNNSLKKTPPQGRGKVKRETTHPKDKLTYL